MQISREQLVQLLRTEGDNDTAEKVGAQLPEQIDTDQQADALAGLGLDRTQLMAKLAGGSFGSTLTP